MRNRWRHTGTFRSRLAQTAARTRIQGRNRMRIRTIITAALVGTLAALTLAIPAQADEERLQPQRRHHRESHRPRLGTVRPHRPCLLEPGHRMLGRRVQPGRVWQLRPLLLERAELELGPAGIIDLLSGSQLRSHALPTVLNSSGVPVGRLPPVRAFLSTMEWRIDGPVVATRWHRTGRWGESGGGSR
jgi:hypothetical protein